MNSSYSDGTTVPKVSPLLALGPNPVPLIGCIGCRSIILKPVDAAAVRANIAGRQPGFEFRSDPAQFPGLI